MDVMHNKLESAEQALAKAELVYDAAQISQALDGLAAQLDENLRHSYPLVLCVMQGGLIFSGHMLTRLKCMLELDYIHATRYRNQTTGDVLEWLVHPRNSLRDRTVLILDDILDEGVTLQAIKNYCIEEGASRVVSAVLVHKNHNRRIDNIAADYVALEVKDRYVFGFGMDYKGQLRHLNSIFALPE